MLPIQSLSTATNLVCRSPPSPPHSEPDDPTLLSLSEGRGDRSRPDGPREEPHRRLSISRTLTRRLTTFAAHLRRGAVRPSSRPHPDPIRPPSDRHPDLIPTPSETESSQLYVTRCRRLSGRCLGAVRALSGGVVLRWRCVLRLVS